MIEADIETAHATYRVTPAFGRVVTFELTLQGSLYVVHPLNSPWAHLSRHRTFEAACKSAHYRAKRYLKAFSVKRPGVIYREQVAA